MAKIGGENTGFFKIRDAIFTIDGVEFKPAAVYNPPKPSADEIISIDPTTLMFGMTITDADDCGISGAGMTIREYEPLNQTWHCMKCGAENTDDFRRQSAPTCAFCDSAYNWVQVIGNREFDELTDRADEMDGRDETYRLRMASENEKPPVVPEEPYVYLLRVVEYTVWSCLRTHRWNDARRFAWMALKLRLRIYRARLGKLNPLQTRRG